MYRTAELLPEGIELLKDATGVDLTGFSSIRLTETENLSAARTEAAQIFSDRVNKRGGETGDHIKEKINHELMIYVRYFPWATEV